MGLWIVGYRWSESPMQEVSRTDGASCGVKLSKKIRNSSRKSFLRPLKWNGVDLPELVTTDKDGR